MISKQLVEAILDDSLEKVVYYIEKIAPTLNISQMQDFQGLNDAWNEYLKNVLDVALKN
jgi:hypothetical protein